MKGCNGFVTNMDLAIRQKKLKSLRKKDKAITILVQL